MTAHGFLLLGWMIMAVAACGSERVVSNLAYAPAPVDNPLKGLVPYAGEKSRWFPHSMEFRYLPLSALVTGEEHYDWLPLEQFLDDVAGRGHQAIFRVFLEYPDKAQGIPAYLVDSGLKIHRWPYEGKRMRTPDYGHPALRHCLQRFIAALGERYDGDPRIGFITAGLLGKWGEWHTHPRTDLWAEKAVQREVMDAYAAAFSRTPILYRYPAGPDDSTRAENASRPLGYHDDSFAWATLGTGDPHDGWFFHVLMKQAGERALTKWKAHPIGGEIRPEAWGRVFDPEPGHPHIQDFASCVEETHVTWLMDTGMFRESSWTAARRARAETEVRRMGYELHVPRASWRVDAAGLEVEVTLENRGVAPFYADWPVEFALLREGRPVRRFAGSGSVQGLLPGQAPRVWHESFATAGISSGAYQLALRIPNPMPGGKPLRLANQTQAGGPEAWLILGELFHIAGDTPPG